MKLTQKDIQFLKNLINNNSFAVQDPSIEHQEWANSRLGMILRQYLKENTMKLPLKVTEQLKSAGISEDEGKSLIAYARRLGIDLS